MLCYRDGLESDPLVAPACLLVSVLIDFGEVRQQGLNGAVLGSRVVLARPGWSGYM